MLLEQQTQKNYRAGHCDLKFFKMSGFPLRAVVHNFMSSGSDFIIYLNNPYKDTVIIECLLFSFSFFKNIWGGGFKAL